MVKHKTVLTLISLKNVVSLKLTSVYTLDQQSSARKEHGGSIPSVPAKCNMKRHIAK